MQKLEHAFETMLWNVRLVVVVPVIISMIVAIGVLLLTTLDAFYLMIEIFRYTTLDAPTRMTVRLETISEVVSIVDGYLLAAIMIIFSLGLYELFVNKIDAAEGSDLAGRLLLIRSLDDLKDRLANVILVILIVKFFQQALKMKYEVPLDLLYLSIGVVLIGATLYLSGKAKNGKSGDKKISDGE